MPNVRLMNWNIERLGATKLGVPGIANNIGRVIADSQADIVIILEVVAGPALASMAAVSAAANAIAGGNHYTGWLVSYATGGEVYGVLVRNLNVVRPVVVTGGPTGADTDNGANAALGDLDLNQFGTWPGTFAAVPNAYAAALPAPAARPRLPLIDVYSSPPRRRRVKRRRFGGRRLAAGGYALGMGFRMPCLTMFNIPQGGGGTTLVPVLACHLGAVRAGANRLARGQVRQYKDTHIAQKFQNPQPLQLPFGGYIDLDLNPMAPAATAIQELVITGDFNVDFLQQNPPPPVNALRTGNRNAFNTVTPTTVNGGSGAPGALPGPANPYAVMPPHAPLPAPVPPFGVLISPPGPSFLDIPDLALKSAVTSQGTSLVAVNPAVVPAALRGACFDNFHFGGTQLSATFQTLTPAPPAADAAQVVDVPAQIVQAGGGGVGALDVSAAQAWYGALFALAVAFAPAPPPPPPPHHHYGYAAPNLAPGAPVAALTNNDRLIGARFISDHLPTVVQFNLP